MNFLIKFGLACLALDYTAKQIGYEVARQRRRGADQHRSPSKKTWDEFVAEMERKYPS